MYVQQIPWEVNYDESRVPPFQLPDPLVSVSGAPIRTVGEWEENREALLETFRRYMYGRRLPQPDNVKYTLLSEKKDALEGQAVMRQIEMEFSMADGRSHKAVMLLFIPAGVSGAVPVFTGLTFHGNHVVCDDPEILITGCAIEGSGVLERTRGFQSRRFPLKEIMAHKFALAVASYHDFFPDSFYGWRKSILPLFLSEAELNRAPRPENVSAIGVWAWGISRMLDCLETLPEIDAAKAAVFGHSRLGKTALWAGAEDTRFKLVCVNDSGCGGAAPSRRLYGETLFAMCRTPEGFGNYWFVPKVRELCRTPELLPVDQHQLISLIAPRCIAVHSATEDQWADPRGEYMSLYQASPVFKLYGRETPASETPPPPETPVGSDMSYFLRTGKHDILAADWKCYMEVFDHALRRG